MRRVIVAVAVSACALLLGGCATVATTSASGNSAASGAWLPVNTEVHRDIAYGSDPLQTLDVYAPQGASDAPILLMVHGGSWVRGDKAATGVVDNKVEHYLPMGFVFVSINYRLSPAVTPVDEAGDVAAALAFVQQHAAEWGAAGQNVVLMGHSAGGNLVSLVAADPTFAANAGADAWRGTIALDSAAYDVVSIMEKPHRTLYDPAFGDDEQLWKDSSPTLRVAGIPAPMLLVCGSGRADACPQAQGFADAVRRQAPAGSDLNIRVYPVALSHGEISSELGTPIDLTGTVDSFLASLGLKIVGSASG